MNKEKNGTFREMFVYVFRTVLSKRFLLYLNIALLIILTLLQFVIPQITQFIIDKVIPQKNITALIWASVAYLGAVIISGAFSYLSTHLMSVMSQNAITQLRVNLYKYLLKLDNSFFENTKTGDLMTRLTSDINNLQTLISPSMLSMVGSMFTFVGVLIFIYIVNWKMALAVSITLPFMLLIYTYFKNRIRSAYQKVRSSQSDMNNHLQNTLTQIQMIKSYTNEDMESDSFTKTAERNRDYTIDANRNQAMYSPLINLVSSTATVFVLLLGGYSIMNNELTVGQLVAYISYVGMLQSPIRQLTSLLNQIQQALVSFGRVRAIMDETPQITDEPDAKDFSDLHEGIWLKNVTFSYPNDENKEGNILTNVSFNIPLGKTTALVGQSGSGKTTLTKLITRLYDIDSGQLNFDSDPIRSLKIKDLRQHIAVVSQTIDILDGTIADNVRYGRLNADDNEIWSALEQADLAEFIHTLPAGLATQVGERGLKLSGGQKQRLSIARAFIKDAPILILDEATASLDTYSERNIQRVLDHLMEKKTTLVIAHRLSTIHNADNIVVMSHGQVIEQGKHDVLIAKSGEYAELYHAQFEK